MALKLNYFFLLVAEVKALLKQTKDIVTSRLIPRFLETYVYKITMY